MKNISVVNSIFFLQLCASRTYRCFAHDMSRRGERRVSKNWNNSCVLRASIYYMFFTKPSSLFFKYTPEILFFLYQKKKERKEEKKRVYW